MREDIAGIVACFRRYGLKQLLGIAALAVERDVRLRDCNVGASEPARSSHRGFVVGGKEPLLYARLVISAAQEFGIDLEQLLLKIGRYWIVAPGLAHLCPCTCGVALR